MRSSLFIALLAVLLPVGALRAASFPCERATTKVEKAVCADEDLSTLDEYLGRYYAGARSALRGAQDEEGGAEACLAADQKSWLRSERDQCGDASEVLSACLRRAYLERLAVLDPLQPGATSIRDRELPGVARSLVWIVPPAADQVAAPPPRNAKHKAPALVAQGEILDEVTTGDGFVLRTTNSGQQRLLIVPLMFLEPPTNQQLASFARSGGRYELRGHAEQVSGRGEVSFAANECVFVYRIAPEAEPAP